MATVGTVLAKDMKIYIGTTAVTCQVDASLKMDRNLFQTTCKDSGDMEEYQYGTGTWSISGRALFRFDATQGFSQFFAMWDGKTTATAVWQTAVSGDKKYSGTVLLKSLSGDANGNDEAVGYQFELQGSGDLTEATVS